jgi:hypothetical protein
MCAMHAKGKAGNRKIRWKDAAEDMATTRPEHEGTGRRRHRGRREEKKNMKSKSEWRRLAAPLLVIAAGTQSP